MTNINKRIDNLVKAIDEDMETLYEQYRQRIARIVFGSEQEAFVMGLECFMSNPPNELSEASLAALRKVDNDEVAHTVLTKIWSRVMLYGDPEYRRMMTDLMEAIRPGEVTS